MAFDFSTTQEKNTFLLKGRFIEPGSDTALLEAVKKQSINHNVIILDLKKLDYLNSSGLNLFLQILTSLRKNGKELELHNISKKVEKLFIITKLHSIFTIK